MNDLEAMDGRGDTFGPCKRCGDSYEAYSLDHAAAIHNDDHPDHPFAP